MRGFQASGLVPYAVVAIAMFSDIQINVAAAQSVDAGSSSKQQAPLVKPTAPTAKRRVGGTEEVVVTAQRRNERLSKTPVAVSVVSGRTLAQAQITSQQDLRVVAPGLAIRAAVNSNQLNYAVRGQSEDPLSDTAPGVVPYINEVQVGGGTGGASAFYDLQSVQVLKGPQGTLFGRSATGGAVLFTTVKPSDVLTGYLSGTGGDYGFMKYEGAVNVPVVPDRAMLRVAGVYEKGDGFQTNVFTNGGTEGDFRREGIRPSLTVKLGDDVTNDLVVDYLHTSGTNTVSEISGLVPYTGVGAPYIPIQYLYAGIATPLARATGIATIQAFLPPAYASLVPGFYNAYFAPGTGHPAGGIAQALAEQKALGVDSVNSDGNNLYHSSNVVLTNATVYDINNDLKLKNIVGYQHTNLFNASDSDGSPFGASQSSTRGGPIQGAPETDDQESEELQLQGFALDRRLTYTTGFYFDNQKTTRATVSTFFDILLGGQSQINNYSLTSRTYAGYGQATYKLNDSGLSVTGGLRYTDETVGKQLLPGDSFRLAAPVAPPGYDYNQSKTYDKLSWQFGLQDQLSPETLLYAVSRRAYKSGGFNGTVSPKVGGAADGGDGYEAERVTDIEVGAKFSGHLAYMPTNLNLALFHDWIQNSQRLAFTLVGANPASLTVNVPKGTTDGAEIDGSLKPFPWLSVGGSVSYIQASYSSQPVIVNTLSQVFDQVPDTAKWSGSIFADVTVPVNDNINVFLHGDVYDQTKTFTTPRSQDDAGAIIGDYALVNFRVGIEDTRTGLSLTANVKNAFNRAYYVGGLATGEIFQINTLIPGQPRTFTIEARYKF